MIRTIFVLGTVLLLCWPAFAATVESVKGKVLINHGNGFRQAASGAQANAGDLLMASAGGSARLVYPNGCQVKVIPGTMVSVGKKPPCTAPSLVGEAPSGFFSNPVPPFAVTAAIGWGIFCATIYCRDHNREGANRQAVAASVASVAHRLAPDGGPYS